MPALPRAVAGGRARGRGAGAWPTQPELTVGAALEQNEAEVPIDKPATVQHPTYARRYQYAAGVVVFLPLRRGFGDAAAPSPAAQRAKGAAAAHREVESKLAAWR